RTSRWGNPFKIMYEMVYCDASHRRFINDPWVFWDGPYPEDELQEYVVNLYDAWIKGKLQWPEIVRPCKFTVDDIKRELKGKDLICFCPLDHPCHAEVLLKIANS